VYRVVRGILPPLGGWGGDSVGRRRLVGGRGGIAPLSGASVASDHAWGVERVDISFFGMAEAERSGAIPSKIPRTLNEGA
jgi:hypothetical protein